MACIYEDTASHGIKGGRQRWANRLVAEITVNGRRRRKRGYDYQELRAWLDEQIKEARKSSGVPINNDGSVRRPCVKLPKSTIKLYLKTGRIRKIMGFSSYAGDTLRNKFYNIETGGIVNPHKANNPNKTLCVILKGDDGKNHNFSLARLKYAIDNGINPMRLPKGFVISDDGSVNTMADSMIELKRERRKRVRKAIFDIMVREVALMREYYNTMDIGPVELYMAERRSGIILKFMKRWRYKGDVDMLYDRAYYKLLQAIEKPGSMITNLSSYIFKEMERIAKIEKRSLNIDDMNYGRGL